MPKKRLERALLDVSVIGLDLILQVLGLKSVVVNPRFLKLGLRFGDKKHFNNISTCDPQFVLSVLDVEPFKHAHDLIVSAGLVDLFKRLRFLINEDFQA